MKQKSTRNKTTAVEFLRSYEQTMNLMESIGDETVREQKALLENQFGEESEYTNDGIFNMDNLLDVNPYDKEEPGIRKEPGIWSAPIEPLDDSDKGQIVEELAKQLMSMKDEVVRLDQIGPIATVIQSTLGLRQNLEDFISNMITGAADKQDSQSFAHGWKDIPGVEQSGETKGEKGPTDIEPDRADIDSVENEMGGVDLGGPEAGIDIELVRPQEDEEFGGDEGLEGIEALNSDEELEDLDGEEGLEGLEGLEGEEGEEGGEGLEEENEESELNREEGDEEYDEENEDDDTLDNIDARLESISQEYKFKSGHIDKNTYIDTQLESLRKSLTGSQKPLVESKVKSDVDTQLKATLESIAGNYRAKFDEKKKLEDVKVHLESIAANYFNKVEQKKSISMLESMRQNYLTQKQISTEKKLEKTLNGLVESYHTTEKNKEKAMISSIRKENELKAKLESISNSYHKNEKVVLEAQQASSTLDSKLQSLVESYHSTSTAPSRASVKQRLQQLEG